MDLSQQNDTFENQLFSITTIIKAEFTVNGDKVPTQASGFYYTEQALSEEMENGNWYRIKNFWLITNRHVVLFKDKGKEYLPDKLTFCLRRSAGGKILWEPILLTKSEILKALNLYKDDAVDVVALDISQNIMSKLEEFKKINMVDNLYIPTALSNFNLPDNQPFTIDVTSDIVVASYPQNFYDTYNKFPIVKSGILASGWGFLFQGKPIFQIDAQLFPGSSGGLVISKPSNLAFNNEGVQYSKIKQFVLLGVYSGEVRWFDQLEVDGKIINVPHSFGLGTVWYSYLIPKIIQHGEKVTSKRNIENC